MVGMASEGIVDMNRGRDSGVRYREKCLFDCAQQGGRRADRKNTSGFVRINDRGQGKCSHFYVHTKGGPEGD